MKKTSVGAAMATWQVVLGLLLLCSMVPYTAMGTSQTWDGGAGDSLWSSANNWSGDTTPPTSGETATFNSGSGTIGLDGITISNIVFDTGSVGSFTLGSGGAGGETFTLGAASGQPGSVSMDSGVTADQTVNANVTLGTDDGTATYTFDNASTSADVTIAGDLTGGPGGVNGIKTSNFAGAGDVTVSGTVSKGGAIVQRITKNGSGTLKLIDLAATGRSGNAGNNTGAVSINDSCTVDLTVAGTWDLVADGGWRRDNWYIKAPSGGVITNGTITLGTAGGTIRSEGGNTLTVYSELTGSPYKLNISNPPNTGGTVVLAGSNTFTAGAIEIGRQELVFSKAENLGTFGTFGARRYANGTLTYVGDSSLTFTNDFLFDQENMGNFTVKQDGVGLLKFTGNWSRTYNGNAIIYLDGTTGDGELSGNFASTIYRVIKNGINTWTLSGTNAYYNTTTVNAGKLCVDGLHTNGATYTVVSGAKLGGSGTIVPSGITMNSGSTLAPGDINGHGTLTISNNLALTSGRTFEFKAGSLLSGEYSQLRMGAGYTVTLGGDLTLDDSQGSGTTGGTITIVNVSEFGGTRSGVFANYADGDTYSGTMGDWTINYIDADGDVTLTTPPARGTLVAVQ